MAHDTTLNAGSGGDTIVTYDLAAGGAYPSGVGKVPASVIYVGTPPAPLTPSNPIPVSGTVAISGGVAASQSGSWSVTVGAALPAGTNLLGGVQVVDSAGANKLGIDVTGAVAIQSGGSPGSAAPSRAVQVGGSDGTNLRAFRLAATGEAYVNAVQAGDVIEIGGTQYTVNRAFVDATASGATTVVAGVASKQIRVLAYAVGPASGAVNVYFKSATAGQISSTKCLATNGGMGRTLATYGHFQTAAGEALQVNLSTGATVGVDLLYILV